MSDETLDQNDAPISMDLEHPTEVHKKPAEPDPILPEPYDTDNSYYIEVGGTYADLPKESHAGVTLTTGAEIPSDTGKYVWNPELTVTSGGKNYFGGELSLSVQDNFTNNFYGKLGVSCSANEYGKLPKTEVIETTETFQSGDKLGTDITVIDKTEYQKDSKKLYETTTVTVEPGVGANWETGKAEVYGILGWGTSKNEETGSRTSELASGLGASIKQSLDKDQHAYSKVDVKHTNIEGFSVGVTFGMKF